MASISNASCLISCCILVLWCTSCETSQSDVGIGLLQIEADYSTLVNFYDEADTNMDSVFSVKLIFEEGSVTTKTTLKNDDPIKFKPFYIAKEKSVLVLQVLEERNGWLRVITDEAKDQEHWVKATGEKIESYADFLTSVYRVRPHQPDQNPLLKTPGNGEVLPLYFNSTCFSITDIDGDWIRVENNPDNCSGEPGITSYPYSGFLRWRKDRKVLISFAL